MLDIVVYNNSQESCLNDETVINGIFSNMNIDYHIHKFCNLDSFFNRIILDANMKKIYIININDNGSFEIIKKIRKNDPYGFIIFISSDNKYSKNILCNRLMIFDYIDKGNNYYDKLNNCIKEIVKIIFNRNTFVFKYNRIIYRVLYSQINYIEKESQIKRCIIHTTYKKLYIVKSLDKLLEILGSSFFRTHQSCIVNVNNIDYIDLCNNEIVFKNGDSTCLLSDRAKKDVNKII